jgi:hypothetical protein
MITLRRAIGYATPSMQGPPIEMDRWHILLCGQVIGWCDWREDRPICLRVRIGESLINEIRRDKRIGNRPVHYAIARPPAKAAQQRRQTANFWLPR